MFGPYLPVYGVGALAFIFTIYKLISGKSAKKKILLIPIVFLGCAIVATTIELIASYLCEWFMGSWPWQTYADYAINFQARIALSPSIRFGLGGALFLYLIQPALEKLFSKFNSKAIIGAGISIAAILIVETVYLVIK